MTMQGTIEQPVTLPVPDDGPSYVEPAPDERLDGDAAPEVPPDPIAEMRAELAAAKAELATERENLRKQAAQPQIEAAKQAFEADVSTFRNHLQALALPEEEVQDKVTAYEQGKQFQQNYGAYMSLAVESTARELAHKMLPETATLKELRDFEAFVSRPQVAGNFLNMETAAQLWVEGRQYRTGAQQRVNAQERATSGAERTEGMAGGYTPPMTSQERYIKALKEGGPLPSSEEIDRLTARYLR